MKRLAAALKTTMAVAVFFTLSGLHTRPPSGDSPRPRPNGPNPANMPKRIGPAQQYGAQRNKDGRAKVEISDEEWNSSTTSSQQNSIWDTDPELAEARLDMRNFGQMGEGAMDKIWTGDGMGSGNHNPDSTEPGKTKFPPGTTQAEVEATFKDIVQNPGSRPQPRANNDGYTVEGTRGGIEYVVTLDQDGSISGGYPLPGPLVETNPR